MTSYITTLDESSALFEVNGRICVAQSNQLSGYLNFATKY